MRVFYILLRAVESLCAWSGRSVMQLMEPSEISPWAGSSVWQNVTCTASLGCIGCQQPPFRATPCVTYPL